VQEDTWLLILEDEFGALVNSTSKMYFQTKLSKGVLDKDGSSDTVGCGEEYES
jgi:hypothetical protein